MVFVTQYPLFCAPEPDGGSCPETMEPFLMFLTIFSAIYTNINLRSTPKPFEYSLCFSFFWSKFCGYCTSLPCVLHALRLIFVYFTTLIILSEDYILWFSFCPAPPIPHPFIRPTLVTSSRFYRSFHIFSFNSRTVLDWMSRYPSSRTETVILIVTSIFQCSMPYIIKLTNCVLFDCCIGV
jgi:hypothetical protein